MKERILAIICEHYEILEMDLRIPCRKPRQVVVEARQTAAYALWRYTTLSNAQIANCLGYDSRQAVMKARTTIREIAEGNKAFADQLKQFENKILRK